MKINNIINKVWSDYLNESNTNFYPENSNQILDWIDHYFNISKIYKL